MARIHQGGSMIRHRMIVLSVVLALLAGCQGEQQVDAPLAPTTVPIGVASPAAPSATAPAAATSAAAAAPTDIAATEPPATQPAAATEVAATPVAVAPTRIVPPADDLQVPEGFGVSVFQG